MTIRLDSNVTGQRTFVANVMLADGGSCSSRQIPWRNAASEMLAAAGTHVAIWLVSLHREQFMKTTASLLFAATLTILPAHAQRSAVSPDLSPAAAGDTFKQAVVSVCLPAVSGTGVSALALARDGKVQPTQDVETRRQAGAAPDETVWDVADARGVVTVREKAGQCVVTVYGPASGPTVADATLALVLRGFEALAGPADGFTQTLTGRSNGRRMLVQLSGANPGTAGHQSKFSVVSATVSLSE